MWGRSGLEICWLVKLSVLVWIGGILRTLKEEVCGQVSWCKRENVTFWILLSFFLSSSLGQSFKTFSIFWGGGFSAISTPAHGQRNVSDLCYVSRVPTRPGIHSHPIGWRSDVIARRVGGCLWLQWAWGFISKFTRNAITCANQWNAEQLKTWEPGSWLVISPPWEGKEEWRHTERRRCRYRNLGGKRDSMSVHADGKRTVSSNRAAESWIQQEESPCPCFAVVCGSNMQLAPLPRTAAVEE